MKGLKLLLFALFLTLIPASGTFALQIGDLAPPFSLRDSYGKNFYLRDHVGKHKKHDTKGLILSFFASYCKPCRKELPIRSTKGSGLDF